MVLLIDSIDHSRDFLMKNQFSGNSQCFYGSPYGIKRIKNKEMFLSTILLKHASPIRQSGTLCKLKTISLEPVKIADYFKENNLFTLCLKIVSSRSNRQSEKI